MQPLIIFHRIFQKIISMFDIFFLFHFHPGWDMFFLSMNTYLCLSYPGGFSVASLTIFSVLQIGYSLERNTGTYQHLSPAQLPGMQKRVLAFCRDCSRRAVGAWLG